MDRGDFECPAAGYPLGIELAVAATARPLRSGESFGKAKTKSVRYSTLHSGPRTITPASRWPVLRILATGLRMLVICCSDPAPTEFRRT